MFTGTVTLRWSAGNLNRFTDDIDSPIHDDLDVLVSPSNFSLSLSFSEFCVCDWLSWISDSMGLGVQEMEEREKVVEHMWDVYTNSRRIRLPRFWQEAFEAAYEDLTSDVPGVRDSAISEIAKMSVRSVDLDPPLVQSAVSTHPLCVFCLITKAHDLGLIFALLLTLHCSFSCKLQLLTLVSLAREFECFD
jgi:hypothetical protein